MHSPLSQSATHTVHPLLPNERPLIRSFGLAALAATVCLLLQAAPAVKAADAQAAEASDSRKEAGATEDPRARALLNAAKEKLKGIDSIDVDIETNNSPSKGFDRNGELFLERPNRFRLDKIEGAITEERRQVAVSDGQRVTRIDNEHISQSFSDSEHFVSYGKPVRAENFFLGFNFLIQFFFDPRPIGFDPADEHWGRAVSLFDTNRAAYDKSTKITLLGYRTIDDIPCDVVELRYNTVRDDIRQQIFIGPDKLVYQVDTFYSTGQFVSEKFRNYQVNVKLPPDTFKLQKDPKMPLVDIDPVRMGAEAPDFTLPNYNDGGPELSMKELLKDKKGMLICVLDGALARKFHNADIHLQQMKTLQELKDKFESQGLVVVCIVGGAGITPDLTDEMKLNWMPDVTRFNYPIAVDVDLERGIQGAAYENFRLNGHNNLLLDSQGRVVFASQDFWDKVNQLAFYQALAQIGFAVSAADLESSAK